MTGIGASTSGARVSAKDRNPPDSAVRCGNPERLLSPQFGSFASASLGTLGQGAEPRNRGCRAHSIYSYSFGRAITPLREASGEYPGRLTAAQAASSGLPVIGFGDPAMRAPLQRTSE